MSDRRLHPDETMELEALNAEVTKAIARRTEWLDRKMLEVSELKPGDDIYEVLSGARLGTVRRLYRYWAKQGPLLDTHLSVEYEYEVRPNSFDNTSRQIGVRFGTIVDVRRRLDILRAVVAATGA